MRMKSHMVAESFEVKMGVCSSFRVSSEVLAILLLRKDLWFDVES